jgi:hypothetical protein
VTLDFEAAKVMLFVRIVGMAKIIEYSDCFHQALYELLPQGSNPGRYQSLPAEQMLSQFVVQLANPIGLG